MEWTDSSNLLEYHSNSAIVRYIPWTQRDSDGLQKYMERILSESTSQLVNDKDYLILVWQLKETGKVVGQSNLGVKSKDNRTAEIGWVTHQDFQRQGFAFEASYELLRHAFQDLKLHRIVAEIDTRATTSAGLASKLGMRLEGEFKEVEFFKGFWCDMWRYAILESEFEKGIK